MRIAHVAAGLAASAVLLANPAAAQQKGAQTPSAERPAPEPRFEHQVKVSLSRENPDVRTLGTSADEIDFYLFIDGEKTRGGEFGIVIDGGELVRYSMDTENAWVTFPLVNPYPGTVTQVGTDCYDTPVRLGTMTVKPTEPGGRVSLDVVPSARDTQATIIRCDNTGTAGFRAFPAAANGKPVAPHAVAGEGELPASPDQHDHDDHDHDDAKGKSSSG
jgi:hypothetical protein